MYILNNSIIRQEFLSTALKQFCLTIKTCLFGREKFIDILLCQYQGFIFYLGFVSVMGIGFANFETMQWNGWLTLCNVL